MKIEIKVGDTKYYLSRLDTTILDRLNKWADGILPDPIVEIKKLIDGFPPDIQMALAKQALEQRTLRRSGQSDDIRALIASPEGARKIIALLLAKYQPALTDAEVGPLIQAIEDE